LGFVVFVVVFAAKIMARTYAGQIGSRQRGDTGKSASTRLNPT